MRTQHLDLRWPRWLAVEGESWRAPPTGQVREQRSKAAGSAAGSSADTARSCSSRWRSRVWASRRRRRTPGRATEQAANMWREISSELEPADGGDKHSRLEDRDRNQLWNEVLLEEKLPPSGLKQAVLRFHQSSRVYFVEQCESVQVFSLFMSFLGVFD